MDQIAVDQTGQCWIVRERNGALCAYGFIKDNRPCIRFIVDGEITTDMDDSDFVRRLTISPAPPSTT